MLFGWMPTIRILRSQPEKRSDDRMSSLSSGTMPPASITVQGGEVGRSWGHHLLAEADGDVLSRRKLAQCTPHEGGVSCHETKIAKLPTQLGAVFPFWFSDAASGWLLRGRSTFGAVYEHRRAGFASRLEVSGINSR